MLRTHHHRPPRRHTVLSRLAPLVLLLSSCAGGTPGQTAATPLPTALRAPDTPPAPPLRVVPSAEIEARVTE
ncbi:hypothetical protein, partial [Ameyamaea chiangmaiensis]